MIRAMTNRQPLSRPRPNREAAAKAVALMGGAVQAAKKLCVSNYQTIQSWATKGVPVAYSATVERLIEGRVTRRELYPLDWQDIWPELASSEQKQSPALAHQAQGAINSEAKEAAHA